MISESPKERYIEKSRSMRFNGFSIFGLVIGSIMMVVTLPGCYSLKSASIPSTINTFFVGNFDLQARNALPTMSQIFGEALRNKILNESRLVQAEINPDISFSGEIVSFRVTSVAPESGSTAAFNRLEIGVSVKYENTIDDKQSWTKRFSFFEDYDRSQNLVDIQDGLVTNINDQLVEDIFNAAFTSW